MLFDTHAHLDQPEFDEDRSEVITRAREAGVSEMVVVGTTVETSEKSAAIAAQFESVYAAVGIQPNYVAEAAADDWDRVLGLINEPSVVALGETGLDLHWDYTPLALQQDYFDRHLRLSQLLDLPLIIHMRDCEEEILAMLREARARKSIRAVMHSFTGSSAMAQECLELGLYISFAGMVTFKKSDDLRAIAATIPKDRLLIETDSPYLSPHPVRKMRRNEPANLRHTATCLAEVCQQSLEEFAARTTANALHFFQR